jgi:hypothetical protein
LRPGTGGAAATAAGTHQHEESKQQEQQAQTARRADPFAVQYGQWLLVIAGRHAM